jgi:hypothetical protein
MTHTGPATVTVAAKIPATLAASLEALTAMHGLSRSAVIRELIAGAVDGAPGFPSVEARAARATGIINARIRQHVRRVEDTLQQRGNLGPHTACTICFTLQSKSASAGPLALAGLLWALAKRSPRRRPSIRPGLRCRAPLTRERYPAGSKVGMSESNRTRAAIRTSPADPSSAKCWAATPMQRSHRARDVSV